MIDPSPLTGSSQYRSCLVATPLEHVREFGILSMDAVFSGKVLEAVSHSMYWLYFTEYD